VRLFEAQLIAEAVSDAGSMQAAAVSLGMSDRNLYKLRRRLGMGEPGRMVVSPDMPHTAGKSQTGRDAAGLS